MQETEEMRVPFLDQEDPLEEDTATHSSILSWRIAWTEDPGGLQSIGLQSRNDWSNWTQLKKIENSHSYKNMYTDIHSRIIHNSINKQLKYPSAEERITQCGIFIQQRILLGNKKEWSTNTCWNMNEPWDHNTKWKKPVIKDKVTCMVCELYISKFVFPLHGSQPCHGKGACITQWSYEPCRIGLPKKDRS